MKAIERLTNVEKAKLLHQLFPAEIPAFLHFAEGMCSSIRQDEQQQREKWDFGLFTFDFWLTLIGQAEKKIEQYGMKLHKNSGLFADQLFDGYLALYMVHCLTVYTTARVHPNARFVKAVDLFFNP